MEISAVCLTSEALMSSSLPASAASKGIFLHLEDVDGLRKCSHALALYHQMH